MAAVNSVGNALTGSTGTGAFVGATSPTLVTPVLGAASATSVSFSSTSGIIGTTTNDNAAAGSVGEVISSVVLAGSAVSLTTSTDAAITNISLTAGDWDVWGEFWTLPDVGTIVSSQLAGINIAATVPGTPSVSTATSSLNFTTAAGIDNQLSVGPCRISLSGTTTIYLVAFAAFSVSTCGAYGKIIARRRR